MRKLGAVDYGFLALYFGTMAYYTTEVFVLTKWFDVFLNVAIPIWGFVLAASSLFDIIALDLIGIFLLFKIGAVKSFMFVVLIGGMQLWTWVMTYLIIKMPGLMVRMLTTGNNWVLFTIAWVALTPLLLYYFRDSGWRLRPLFFLFPIYYIIYFLYLGAPYTYGSSYNTQWELLYEFLLDVAFVSGWVGYKMEVPAK
jgi:hypothetical protein